MLTGSWVDVIARTRGLASRLLGRRELEHLAGLRSLAGITGELEATAYHGVGQVDQPTPAALERMLRRAAGQRVAVIESWCGSRLSSLAPLFEDEDRRNLRMIARGVAAHAPPEQCGAGMLPTPSLPMPLLDELAHARTLSDLATTLVAWSNPYGSAMLAEAAREHPSLFAVQLSVDRTFVTRAARAAIRVGAPLDDYVETLIDMANVRTALAIAARRVEQDGSSLYMEGGRLVPPDLFRELCANSLADARTRLAPVAAGTVLAPLVSGGIDEGEDAVLTAMLRRLRRSVRLSPLTLAVVLEYVLALRAELQDLGRIIWGTALGVPPRRIVSRLVTP